MSLAHNCGTENSKARTSLRLALTIVQIKKMLQLVSLIFKSLKLDNFSVKSDSTATDRKARLSSV
jgi:hypothetical protein